jgi:hypothetical protein
MHKSQLVQTRNSKWMHWNNKKKRKIMKKYFLILYLRTESYMKIKKRNKVWKETSPLAQKEQNLKQLKIVNL